MAKITDSIFEVLKDMQIFDRIIFVVYSMESSNEYFKYNYLTIHAFTYIQLQW